jgi:3-deoxy-7-phosphoheptulonate synthase
MTINDFIIAGPCSIESKDQFFKVVEFLRSYGIKYIRGGIWKYRSDPDTFQGTNMAMDWVREAKENWNFDFVCEIMECDEIEDFVVKHIDVIQIGSRNMTNTHLLKAINKKFPGKIVLLKRDFTASLEAFVRHSEYLEDMREVWMCLRGAQSMHPQEQRFIPDIADIQRLKEMTGNKIIYDPSHAACESKYVDKIIHSALEFDPNGMMIEVHPNPKKALSDPDQQLDFKHFDATYKSINKRLNKGG